jgi:hypothetical protein
MVHSPAYWLFVLISLAAGCAIVYVWHGPADDRTYVEGTIEQKCHYVRLAELAVPDAAHNSAKATNPTTSSNQPIVTRIAALLNPIINPPRAVQRTEVISKARKLARASSISCWS